ncbi:ABC transporter ATP-binding protein [Parenemella sanctibonifatiensis]
MGGPSRASRGIRGEPGTPSLGHGQPPDLHWHRGVTMSAPTTTARRIRTAAASAVNLTKEYGEGRTAVTAVDNISVELAEGSFTAIMGPSGSGKSTLMHCLAGLDAITSGQVFLAGEEISAMSDRKLTKLRRDRVGFVFQSFNLLPALTAYDNIVLPLELAGHKPDRAHLDSLVDSLGLSERLHHRPGEMSGGQQQRVAIARALITRPAVLFADEPTGALDSRTGQQLLDYLRRCSDEDGQSIVMVTHDPHAAGYADRALILSDGQIVEDIDSPEEHGLLAAMSRLGDRR